MISALTKQESSAISHLRVLAMLSIVTCHFLQALNNQWAWVLNIGVQIFLFMSGFLYGHKHIDNWLNWFEKRITRVYIPFLLFFIAVIPLYAFSKLISFKNIVSYILDLQWFTGGGKRTRTSLVSHRHCHLLCHNTGFTMVKKNRKSFDMAICYSRDKHISVASAIL